MSACKGMMRSLSEISEEQTVHFGVDLVAAARRNLGFLRLVSDSHWLHHKSTILEAIRRYDELWMPLIADLSTEGSKPPMILPPLDIEWVWFCHTLNPENYRHYCESRFSRLIGKPTIFDEENEEYALKRCREIWGRKFPSEPFENEADDKSTLEYNYSSVICGEYLLDQVWKQRNLLRRFYEPYYSETVYLVAAKQRYRGFLYMVHNHSSSGSLVPTSDILLMWLTHQTYPTIYEVDVKVMEEDLKKIVRVWEEAVEEKHVEETKMLWEKIFDEPYEKVGGATITTEPPFYWDVTYSDVNTRYKSMAPRFLLEVCVSVKSITKNTKRDVSRDQVLRLRMVKCHRELKLDKPISDFKSESWEKAWHLYCEFGTKGIILEMRQSGGHRYFKGSSSSTERIISFVWNELLHAPSLSIGKEIDERWKIMCSITPPVQASYLLKCVPDRVTDDSGAMISDVILRMSQYRPQEGRWLSRTILDHTGRECFVTRMRIGGGFWRRGGEIPTCVKWEDRIIEISEGSWSYVTGSTSIGRSPEKVVGTATPKEPREGCQALWSFSTGDILLIHWDSSKSISGLRFDLQNENSCEPTVKLLQGRQLQYQVKKSTKEKGSSTEEEDEYFVTIIRYGKATALLNWKLLVVEILPEEDAVLILLICLSILRSISEMKRKDIGKLLARRRVREANVGDRDWGSVVLHPSSSVSSNLTYVQPWYWNANLVMAPHVNDQVATSPPSLSYSQAEGGDKLYKSCIIP